MQLCCTGPSRRRIIQRASSALPEQLKSLTMTLRIARNVSLSRRNRPMTGRMSRAVIACTCAMLAACSNVVVMSSANYNSRVDYLVIHATSEDFAESLRLLTQPTVNPVSSHYLVPAPFDPTYPRDDLRSISWFLSSKEPGTQASATGQVRVR